jgi:hypothetical protein
MSLFAKAARRPSLFGPSPREGSVEGGSICATPRVRRARRPRMKEAMNAAMEAT